MWCWSINFTKFILEKALNFTTVYVKAERFGYGDERDGESAFGMLSTNEVDVIGPDSLFSDERIRKFEYATEVKLTPLKNSRYSQAITYDQYVAVVRQPEIRVYSSIIDLSISSLIFWASFLGMIVIVWGFRHFYKRFLFYRVAFASQKRFSYKLLDTMNTLLWIWLAVCLNLLVCTLSINVYRQPRANVAFKTMDELADKLLNKELQAVIVRGDTIERYMMWALHDFLIWMVVKNICVIKKNITKH